MSTPTATTPGYGTFRGFVACTCLMSWLPVFEAELQRRGLLEGPMRLYQLTGLGSKSGGTHAEGGAVDDDQVADAAIALARQMGADASWHRPLNWDGKGGMAHAHRVLRGCPHNGPARYQIAAIDDGFNGLGRGGRGGPDTGPRPLSGRTWREGIAWARREQEEDDMNPDEKALLKRAAADAEHAAKQADANAEAIAAVAKSVLDGRRTANVLAREARARFLAEARRGIERGETDDQILDAVEKIAAKDPS